MATIEKRGNGQWRVKVRKRGYQQQSKSFTTKAAASAYSGPIWPPILEVSGHSFWFYLATVSGIKWPLLAPAPEWVAIFQNHSQRIVF